MRWKRAIIGFLIGLAFAVVYAFLAFAAAGAGHGTFIFFAAISPYGLGLLVFPALGLFAGDLRPFLSKILFVGLLVVHYGVVVNFVRVPWMRDPTYIDKTWAFSPWYILLPAGFYIGANVVLWVLFVANVVRYR